MSTRGHAAAGCPFCEIVAGRSPARIVHESPHTLAFLPLRPATRGHTLVVPKRHVTDLWQLDTLTAHPLMESVLLVAQGIRSALSPEGLNLINSAGEVASQTVFHLHMHLVPRWPDDGMGHLWPESENPGDEQLDSLTRVLREGISEAGGRASGR
jgi:histidine triad (HIT) family protein